MKRKSLLLAVVLSSAMILSACSDSDDDKKTSYDVSGEIDYAGKDISSAKVCLDVNNNGLADDGTNCVDTNDGSYNITSSNNPKYYPLVAYIQEKSQVQAKVTLDSKDYDSILYAPRGESSKISIATTLVKSLMDKDSSLKLDKAKADAETIITKADKPETILNLYNKALNSDIAKDLISTSIRGLVSVITDKLENESTITENTNIIVTKEEVEKANNQIKEADKNVEKEPAGDTQLTPLEKFTEILNNAEVKADKNNPVNLNEHLDSPYSNNMNGILSEIKIKSDTFGEFDPTALLTKRAISTLIYYKEEGWPSDSKLELEVVPNINDDNGDMWYSLGHYDFEEVNICEAGKVNGIFYNVINANINWDDLSKCYELAGEDRSETARKKVEECYVNLLYDNKDKTIEKYYWTIDTTLLDECKNN